MALAPDIASFERELRDAIDPKELWRHLEVFDRLQRLDGTEDERKSVEYIAEEMRKVGVQCDILEYETYVSRPGPGRLEVISPERFEIPTRTRAFSPSTPPGGLEVEVVWVGPKERSKGGMIFTHHGREEDFKGQDLRGKAVLTTGGRPDGVMYAQQAGAVALIDVWPSDEDVLHEMTVSSIWGTPTPDSADRLVRIPVMTVRNREGIMLRDMLEKGPVRLRIEGEVFTGPEKITQPVATIPGTEEPERFLLMGAHIDSWYEGVTDNGTANAVLLEVARILATRRGRLRRGVRFGWWSGHSQGRYAGSAWYGDAFWEDMYKGCVAYLNIDGPGCRGASVFDCRYTMAEYHGLVEQTVKDLVGAPANVRRPFKAADQSFWGLGVPSFSVYRMLPEDHPDKAIVGGCSGAWWWHSTEDRIDKVDLHLLKSDTEIYATLVARICGSKVLPFKVTPMAQDFVSKLNELQDAAQGGLDLSLAISRATELQGLAAELDAISAAADSADNARAETINDGLLKVARILDPVLYTEAGEFDQDPAIQLPMLPGLRRAKNLAEHAPGTKERLFLDTYLMRQRNRVNYALLEANETVEGLVRQLS